ncbi:ABC transporter permease [Pseudohongiella sp.]|uniref:ABC transmembrane type-1 domain-containing protein n=1 Tax=marine sediment metagenome TaxID=412755 RepID=A0A0F9W6A1_9ZZZZ|nr:ABC transporter permease [Pseudohongiella sp.]
MKLLARKLPWLLGTLFAVSFFTFMLVSLLPGDPAVMILGAGGVSPEAIAQLRLELGLDRPLVIRYFDWLGSALSGDLGRSPMTGQSVTDAILSRLPVTIQLGVMAIVIALALAIPLAMVSAYFAGSRLDRSISGVGFALMSVPGFMMAIFLILIFAVGLGWFPATGWVSLTDSPAANLRSALLPALSLAMIELALYMRLLRTDLIDTLQQDYITLARAKGLPNWLILTRHALRPSSFSLMTVVGLQLGGVISGAIIVEEIFALPGVGRLLYQSILQRDLLMVQGIVLFIATAYVVVNFLVDLCYSLLDPRVRYAD